MNADKGQAHIETLAVHAGLSPDPTTGAVVPPLHLSTTYERAADGSFSHGFIYARSDSPNRQALETCLAALEGGAAAAVFSSGCAATMTVLQALAPGDHVVAPTDVYYGTARLLLDVLAPWGLASTFVDMGDWRAVERAVRPGTKLVWVETPSNPLLRIADVTHIAAIAHDAGARCVCDNTWATPVLQRPFDLGADLTMHSTTKYLGGHHDVLGGAIVTRLEDGFFARIRTIQQSGGAVPSPFDCWLTMRGIRTLPYRLRAHSENAMRLALFLAGHPSVQSVHYPGLNDDPGHDLAVRQMSHFGGMISFQVKGGRAAAMAVASKVRLITRATSLGGPESLIEHRASMEGPGTQTPEDLLRLSVGLENSEDLIEDLDLALR